ncbi:MAG: hypothetical protein QXP36_03695 [Conexivisphaerales archaeon]
MSEEIYNNLPAKEIAKILKDRIESGKPFKVTFTSDFKIHISLSYIPKTHRFSLTVEHVLSDKTVDKEEINVRVPDQFVHGLGTLAITPLGTGFDIVAYSTKVTVFREKMTPNSTFTNLYIWG